MPKYRRHSAALVTRSFDAWHPIAASQDSKAAQDGFVFPHLREVPANDVFVLHHASHISMPPKIQIADDSIKT